MERPWSSQDNSFVDTDLISSFVIGYLEFPWTRRFMKSQKPEPSHCNIFMILWFLLQNTNMDREYGSRLKFNLTIDAKPLKLRLQSVGPQARKTEVPEAKSSIRFQCINYIFNCVRMAGIWNFNWYHSEPDRCWNKASIFHAAG